MVGAVGCPKIAAQSLPASPRSARLARSLKTLRVFFTLAPLRVRTHARGTDMEAQGAVTQIKMVGAVGRPKIAAQSLPASPRSARLARSLKTLRVFFTLAPLRVRTHARGTDMEAQGAVTQIKMVGAVGRPKIAAQSLPASPRSARLARSLKTLRVFFTLAPLRVRTHARGTDMEAQGAVTQIKMVGAVGFEPTSLPARAFKAPASANSATPPWVTCARLP